MNASRLLLPLFALSLGLLACDRGPSSDDGTTDTTDSTAVAAEETDTVSIDEVTPQMTSPDNDAQAFVDELLTTVKDGDHATAATMIGYRGPDETRLFTDAYDYTDPNEKSTVDITCDVMRDWMKTSESYEFMRYQEMPSENGTVHVVEVIFKATASVNRKFFSMLEAGDGYLLVSIDSEMAFDEQQPS